MKTFDNQCDLTAWWEQGPNGGPALKAYKCPAGVWTIGFGQARKLPDGTPIAEGMICTEGQAREWLEYELSQAEVFLQLALNGSNLIVITAGQLDSLCDYTYNCGPHAFPRLLRELREGEIISSSLEFLDGFYAAKKPLMGLLLRRISEYNTFLTGEYKAWEKGDPISQDLKDKLLAKNSNNKAGIAMINKLGVK